MPPGCWRCAQGGGGARPAEATSRTGTQRPVGLGPPRPSFPGRPEESRRPGTRLRRRVHRRGPEAVRGHAEQAAVGGGRAAALPALRGHRRVHGAAGPRRQQQRWGRGRGRGQGRTGCGWLLEREGPAGGTWALVSVHLLDSGCSSPVRRFPAVCLPAFRGCTTACPSALPCVPGRGSAGGAPASHCARLPSSRVVLGSPRPGGRTAPRLAS